MLCNKIIISKETTQVILKNVNQFHRLFIHNIVFNRRTHFTSKSQIFLFKFEHVKIDLSTTYHTQKVVQSKQLISNK